MERNPNLLCKIIVYVLEKSGDGKETMTKGNELSQKK